MTKKSNRVNQRHTLRTKKFSILELAKPEKIKSYPLLLVSSLTPQVNAKSYHDLQKNLNRAKKFETLVNALFVSKIG